MKLKHFLLTSKEKTRNLVQVGRVLPKLEGIEEKKSNTTKVLNRNKLGKDFTTILPFLLCAEIFKNFTPLQLLPLMLVSKQWRFQILSYFFKLIHYEKYFTNIVEKINFISEYYLHEGGNHAIELDDSIIEFIYHYLLKNENTQAMQIEEDPQHNYVERQFIRKIKAGEYELCYRLSQLFDLTNYFKVPANYDKTHYYIKHRCASKNALLVAIDQHCAFNNKLKNPFLRKLIFDLGSNLERLNAKHIYVEHVNNPTITGRAKSIATSVCNAIGYDYPMHDAHGSYERSFTPLQKLFAFSDDLGLFESLLSKLPQAQQDEFFHTGYKGMPFIYYKVINHDADGLLYLLNEIGMDLYVKDKFGRNIFHYVIAFESYVILDQLLEILADSVIEDLLKDLDYSGKSVAHYMAKNQFNLNIMEKLSKYAVSFTEQDAYGNTPLHYFIDNIFITYPQLEEIINFLHQQYIDEETTNKFLAANHKGETALDFLTSWKQYDLEVAPSEFMPGYFCREEQSYIVVDPKYNTKKYPFYLLPKESADQSRLEMQSSSIICARPCIDLLLKYAAEEENNISTDVARTNNSTVYAASYGFSL